MASVKKMLSKIVAGIAVLIALVHAQNQQLLHLEVVNHNTKPVYLEILSNHAFRPVLLQPKQTVNETFRHPFNGRIFGRVDCENAATCARDGIIPVTIAAIQATRTNVTTYDVSLESGFNTDITIEPLNVTASGRTCAPAACTADILAVCPKELQLERGGKLVACRTACEAFRTDQYCCRGQYGTAATCDVTKWPTNYVDFFHKQCPNTYAYRFDSRNNTYTCEHANHFRVTFGRP